MEYVPARDYLPAEQVLGLSSSGPQDSPFRLEGEADLGATASRDRRATVRPGARLLKLGGEAEEGRLVAEVGDG